MVGFNLEVANSVLEKGGQWGLALMREDCMEFMNNPPCTVPIMALLGVMNDLWIIVHGSIIHPKKASIQRLGCTWTLEGSGSRPWRSFTPLNFHCNSEGGGTLAWS